MNKFMLGVNYWASNAGMYMWRRFDKEVIEKDFKLLSEHGVDTIRIFPIWSDFQPVFDAYVGSHHTHHLRVKDQPLKTPAGLDPVMLERFATVLDLAEKYGMRVIVALITGWMSGRLFLPELLYNKNLLTDPLAIVWECKFIKEFIPHFKDKKCIIAWEPGNECNCLTIPLADRSITPEQAELWTIAITNTIRSTDPSRPVYSGMYFNNLAGPWNEIMLSDYVDMQTTHPYPLFTPFCSVESLNTMRSALHSAAQTSLFAGVSNQPCLVEEIGTLGATVLSDDYSAEYLEKSLYSSIQYETPGFIWWCAFDQDRFDFPPYDGAAIETTLGLAYSDGRPKKILEKMRDMSSVIAELGEIPTCKKDAVVILTDPDNTWKHAYGAFCLAAEAGATLEFSYKSRPLKSSDRYIIPCIGKDTGLKFIDELIEKVREGAKLLITYDGGHIAPFEKLTGLRVLGREMSARPMSFSIMGGEITIPTEKNLVLEAVEAEVICRSGDDTALTRNKIGKGEVYFLNAPLENAYSSAYKPYLSELYRVYKFFFDGIEKPLTLGSKLCSITYHDMPDGCVRVMITRFDERTEIPCVLAKGYKIKSAKFCDIVNDALHFDGYCACIDLSKTK